MRILIVSAEVSPFAKVGGLADVAGALPGELARMHHDVRVAMPSYPMVEDDARHKVYPLLDDLRVPWADGGVTHSFVKTTSLGDVPVYLVGSHTFFRDATESRKVYQTGWAPYAFFARGVLEMLKHLEPRWIPDVIHVNDWHPGLTAVYLKTLYANDPDLSGVAAVTTVHNLAFQGEFEFDVLAQAGLPADLYSLDKLECFGHVNFLKGSMVHSEMTNTVSETYACEIQTEEYGCRLDGFLRHMAYMDRLRGIVNGIDYSVFDPATDSRIKANYSAEDVSGKAKCKAALQKELGLPVTKKTPVFGMVTRLTDQKGLDLLKKAMPWLMEQDIQLVILGTGDPAYERYFTAQATKHPEKVSATIGFDAALAQRIYAGSDFFLMPSRFEPCGLGQMIAARYGSVPVVRRTGGLADTITEFAPASGQGNGFVFESYDWKQFRAAIDRAIAVYADTPARAKLVSNAMRSDFSTSRMAKHYESLYEEAIRRLSSAMAA